MAGLIELSSGTMVPSMIVALCLTRSPSTLPRLMCGMLLMASLRSVFCEAVRIGLVTINESSVELFATHPNFNVATAFSKAWFEKFGSFSTIDNSPLLTVIGYPANTFLDAPTMAPSSALSPFLATGIPLTNTLLEPCLTLALCTRHMKGGGASGFGKSLV